MIDHFTTEILSAFSNDKACLVKERKNTVCIGCLYSLIVCIAWQRRYLSQKMLTVDLVFFYILEQCKEGSPRSIDVPGYCYITLVKTYTQVTALAMLTFCAVLKCTYIVLLQLGITFWETGSDSHVLLKLQSFLCSWLSVKMCWKSRRLFFQWY